MGANLAILGMLVTAKPGDEPDGCLVRHTSYRLGQNE